MLSNLLEPASATASGDASTAARKCVLLVSNRAKYLTSAAVALEGQGHLVTTALDAEQAVTQIIAHRPDLILIGRSLRGMDGFTLAKHLKSDAATRGIRIVAWTVSESTSVQQTAAASGFDGYILKSTDDTTFAADVARFLADAAPPSSLNVFPRRSPNVLIVDDNALGRELLAALLKTQGCTTFEAANGLEALSLLERHAIDVVISDVLMPSMDGFQLCHKIRGDPRFEDVPVIIYSGSLTSSSNETLAEELGAVRFLRKPAPLEAIGEMLREVIAEAESRRDKRPPIPESASGPGDSERQLKNEVARLNLRFHEVTEQLLQKHHELLLLARALEQSEGTLREQNTEFEEDLRLAREAQLAMLPRAFPTFPPGSPPQDSALRFHQRYNPKRTVGGDFFDVPAVSETKAGVFICDVMGHGMRAALITAVIRGMIEQLAVLIPDPGQVLAEINRVLVPILQRAESPMFTSAFYMVADAASGEIRFANAGHPSPFLIHRESGEIERLGMRGGAHGPALGLMVGSHYSTDTRVLSPRDVVVLFTDGIFEVDGPDEEQFGQERLVDAVRRRVRLPPGRILDGVMEEVRRFSVTDDFEDDVCLIGLEMDHLC